MKISDVVLIALTNLQGNRLRTMLTIMGIGVGIATIVFLVSLGYGLEQLSVQRIASIEAVNTVNVAAGKLAIPDESFVKKYEQDARVEKVLTVNSLPIQAESDSKKIDGVASIVPNDYFTLEGLRITAGNSYEASDTKSAVISSGLVKGLDLAEAEMIGQPVTVKFFIKKAGDTNTTLISETIKVFGVYTDDATIAAFVSPDILEATGELPFSQVKVKVRDRGQVLEVKNELENSGYSVSSVADTISQLDTVFRIVKIVLAIFGGVALVVASIGMFNTMTIALLERTRDVGIMKATGSDNGSIYLIFLVEAILISVLGGLSGLALGWTTTQLVNYAINGLARSVGGEPVDLFHTPLNFVMIMLAFSFAVGFSTGFLPARRGARLNPLEALRYE